MPKTDYLTKPYGDRPADPVKSEAFDFLMNYGGDGGAAAVKRLADFVGEAILQEREACAELAWQERYAIGAYIAKAIRARTK